MMALRLRWQVIEDNGGGLHMVRWDELQLFDRDNDPVTDPERIRAALTEFRETGAMDGYFFERLNLPHEDPDDASSWGPASPEHVDWTGLDAGDRNHPKGVTER